MDLVLTSDVCLKARCINKCDNKFRFIKTKTEKKTRFGQTELPDHDSIFKSESVPLMLFKIDL